jgi:hypothetical protein
MAASLGTLPSSTPRPRVLLWIPVHVSEPTSNLEALVACTFTRHAPSLAGEAFDVLITLAGGASDGREADLVRIVEAGVSGLTAPRPTVRTEFVGVADDTYDRDHSKGDDSSFVGPNTIFYAVMFGGERGKATNRTADGREKGTAPAGREGGTAPAGSEGGATPAGRDGGATSAPALDGSTTASASRQPALPPSIYHRHIAPYAFVQVVETDCCALQAGWLDTLLEPMLLNPGLLLSGSRPRAAYYGPAEHGGTGCRLRLPAGAREHINGNALYRVGPGMQALVRDAMALSMTELPYDLAMFLARKDNQSHVHDHPRVYSMAGVLDDTLWEEPAYYGVDKGVAFVHAPRRLRMDGLLAVASRTDKETLTTAVVVVAGGGGGDLAGPGPAAPGPVAAPGPAAPGPASRGPAAPIPRADPGRRAHAPGHLAIDVPRLRACHASLQATPVDHSLVYVAPTWPAFVEASRLAPFRVLLANGTQAGGDAAAGVLASRALRGVSALARAGLTLAVVGTDTTLVGPSVAAADRDRAPGTARVRLQDLAGLVDGLDNVGPRVPDLLAGPAVLEVGTMLVGAGDAPADSLERWAAVVDEVTTAAVAAQASRRQQRHQHQRLFACGLIFCAPSIALCRAVLMNRPRSAKVLAKKRGTRPGGLLSPCACC